MEVIKLEDQIRVGVGGDSEPVTVDLWCTRLSPLEIKDTHPFIHPSIHKMFIPHPVLESFPSDETGIHPGNVTSLSQSTHAQAPPSGACKWMFVDSTEPETMLPLPMMSIRGVEEAD